LTYVACALCSVRHWKFIFSWTHIDLWKSPWKFQFIKVHDVAIRQPCFSIGSFDIFKHRNYCIKSILTLIKLLCFLVYLIQIQRHMTSYVRLFWRPIWKRHWWRCHQYSKLVKWKLFTGCCAFGLPSCWCIPSQAWTAGNYFMTTWCLHCVA